MSQISAAETQAKQIINLTVISEKVPGVSSCSASKMASAVNQVTQNVEKRKKLSSEMIKKFK